MGVLYAVTIGVSALLLFLIQPMMAKAILPLYGGSAGVWLVSMLFFQTMLLGGYLYSFLATRFLGRRAQRLVHVALLLGSGLFLFAGRRIGVATGGANPTLSILLLLFLQVGPPYVLLSSTSPLLQSWLAGSSAGAVPYRLFALSNLASLAALLAYPVAIEPAFHLRLQLQWWFGGYVLFGLLVCVVALSGAAGAASERTSANGRPLLWVGLAACASALWLSVANHLSQEVAPVPFLWVLPLTVYLLSFVICFDREGWYRPGLFRWLLPVAWIGAASRLAGRGPEGLAWELGIFLIALFIWCMFCHGEIARSKPGLRGVAFFYLMIALGGALGGFFVAVISPLLFSTYLELPVGIAASVLLALPLIYGVTSKARLARLGAVAAVAFIVAVRFQAGFGDVAHSRNFYGAMQITDAGEGDAAVRAIYNGRTLHGIEFTAPDRARLATGYYGPESGAGRVLLARQRPMRAAFVGLGAGTLAAYGHRGDEFRFFEINPAVIDAASRYFHFLRNSEAHTVVIQNDGRLALHGERPTSLDVIVLDAFADDSIPVHLLTREAFQLYFSLLKSDGVLAIHITNRYLDLAPVVRALAADLGRASSEVHNAADPARQVLAADWIVIASEHVAGPAQARTPQAPVWTDDYSNLFSILK